MYQVPESPDTTSKKTFSIPSINHWIAILGIVFGLLVVVGCKYFSNITNTETIGVFASIIACVALIYNAMHLQNNFKLNFFIHQRKYDLDKRIVALNIISEWYKDFKGESKTVKQLKDDHYKSTPQLGDDELVKVINGDMKMNLNNSDTTELDYKKALIALLNYFEKISISILTDTADETILKDYFKDMFISYCEVFKPYILSRRKGAGALKDAFINFEKIVNKWNVQAGA